MADYWKSQERKYCDFCRCWIADNKPSVEFHEKGRRHQDNVSKRLKSIYRKSKRDEKETVKIDAAIQHMEMAALEAYRKDMEANPDLSSVRQKGKRSSSTIQSEKQLWHQEKSRSGQITYRNIITNEIVQTPPPEGFLTLKEVKLISLDATKKQMDVVQRQQQIEGKIRFEELLKQDDEERARVMREKMKERRAEPLPEPVYAPLIPPGPSTPYGQWQKVEKKEVKEVDWQLPPQPEYQYPVVAEPEPEPAPKEFKEKVVESLGDGSATFKKRKISSRNARQRTDDD